MEKHLRIYNDDVNKKKYIDGQFKFFKYYIVGLLLLYSRSII